ncbi:TPA: RepB family plasmid replication initiator protein [Vibrio vulnificus]|nr:RepB family plasmid replication initiator protein [Vibrio vulnificus]HAT8506372.1 RepB family plasmid replication initiator protein [Vibrio vulnificus]HDY7585074.1 replication initiation protein [Vibrio vulnificus]
MGSLVTPFGTFRKEILAIMANKKGNKQTVITKVELPVIDSFQLRMAQTYQSNKVMSPTHFKLKNEWVFADYALSVSALRLLYFSAAHFDDNAFYDDEKVREKKGKLSTVSQRTHSIIYKESASRTIVIPATVLMKVIQSSRSKGKSNNYKPLNDAILELNSAKVTLNSKKSGKPTSKTIPIFDDIEMFKLQKFEISTKIYVKLIFSTKFMPLLIACSGYTTVPFDTLTNLSSSYAMRYYHWCLYGLKKGVSGRFSVSANEIRKRFKISDGELRHHFDSRCIQKPIDEVMANTDLEIYIEELQRANKTKRRAKLEVATFNVTQLPEGISSS